MYEQMSVPIFHSFSQSKNLHLSVVYSFENKHRLGQLKNNRISLFMFAKSIRFRQKEYWEILIIFYENEIFALILLL